MAISNGYRRACVPLTRTMAVISLLSLRLHKPAHFLHEERPTAR
jgi:hypothetical protein